LWRVLGHAVKYSLFTSHFSHQFRRRNTRAGLQVAGCRKDRSWPEEPISVSTHSPCDRKGFCLWPGVFGVLGTGVFSSEFSLGFLTCIRICLMRSNAVSGGGAGGGTSGLPTAFGAFLDPFGLLPPLPPPPPPPTLLCFVGRGVGGGGEYREYGVDETSRCRLGLMICTLSAMMSSSVRTAASLKILHALSFAGLPSPWEDNRECIDALCQETAWKNHALALLYQGPTRVYLALENTSTTPARGPLPACL
jgi:hypothetical protein